MSTNKEIVKNAAWQELRESLVGTWKHTPEQNCELLRHYLDDFSDPLKTRRVLNYLTGSAFRFGIIKHKKIDILIQDIKTKRNERKTL